jgi:class 3 adenylate cyclase
MWHGSGPRTRRLLAFFARRARAGAEERARLDAETVARFFRRRALVYTDTADFTLRARRQGILDFLMRFDQVVRAVRRPVARTGGTLLKVEADSLLLRFADVESACTGVLAIEGALRSWNRGLPRPAQFRFSYGIGYGDVVEVEGDLYGLEMNYASKLGEDMARPGQVLLTPSASGALVGSSRFRTRFHAEATLGGEKMLVRRLLLARA